MMMSDIAKTPEIFVESVLLHRFSRAAPIQPMG